MASFYGTFEQSLTERNGRIKKIQVETLWRTLAFCDTNYGMKKQSDVKVTCFYLKISS